MVACQKCVCGPTVDCVKRIRLAEEQPRAKLTAIRPVVGLSSKFSSPDSHVTTARLGLEAVGFRERFLEPEL